MIAYIEDSLNSQIEDYQDRIDSQEKLLEIKEESLRREFIRMEIYLSQIATQSQWLTQQIAQLNANWTWGE